MATLDMKDSTRLTDSNEDRRVRHQRHQSEERNREHTGTKGCGHGGVGGGGTVDGNKKSQSRGDFVDDECSIDSGCSSGGSTGSAERLSGRGSAERLCRAGRSPRSHCYLNRLRGRPTRSQERLPGMQRHCEHVRAKTSRSWSPGDVRTLGRGGESPSYSPSPSDEHSSDSDSLKRPCVTDIVRRAFQSLKISCKWDNKEKKQAKKSPRRILRSPVLYMYVKGISGLPTQRVPRNAAQQLTMSYYCQDPVCLYQ